MYVIKDSILLIIVDWPAACGIGISCSPNKSTIVILPSVIVKVERA